MDPFPCDRWCGDDGKLIPALQERRRCSLPFYRGRWGSPDYDVDGRLLQWVGRQLPGQREPPEDIEADGCPGGWQHSGFARSFHRYRRRRLEGGAHDINPRITAATPEHVLEALEFFETCEQRAENDYYRKAQT